MQHISRVRATRLVIRLGIAITIATAAPAAAQGPVHRPGSAIPLPENPRPDFERAQWLNLNGEWRFRFDSANDGERARWYGAPIASTDSILVPFSWAAPLSGVTGDADIGWYERTIDVPSSWRGKRIFLVVGASDWRTSAWLDGAMLGEHQGGYTPFSMELTPNVKYGSSAAAHHSRG